MNLSDNEKYLRELLGDGMEELDTEAIWKDVQPRLKKKKKRRIIIWWFLGIGLLAFMLVFTNYYLGKEKSISQEMINHSEDDTSRSNGLNELYNSENDGKVNAENRISENENINENDKKSFSNKNNLSSNKSSLNESNLINNNKYDVNFYDLNTSPNLLNSKVSEVIIGTSEILEKETNLIDEKEAEIEDKVNIVKAKPSIEKEKEDKKEDKKEVKKEKKKKKESKVKWTPYISTTSSIAYPVRMLSSDGSFFGNELKDIRNQYERPLEAYQFATNLRFIHKKKGLILNVGFYYENVDERLKFQEELIETTSEPGITSMVLDVDGNIISQQDGIIQTTTITTRNISIYNNYRFVNMPLGIGYRMKNKKFSMEYEGGVDINLFFQADGFAFNADKETVKLKTITTKKTLAPNLWASVTMDYPISDIFSLTGGIQLKQQLGSLTKKDYELQQRYFIPSLNVGAKFLLK